MIISCALGEEAAFDYTPTTTHVTWHTEGKRLFTGI